MGALFALAAPHPARAAAGDGSAALSLPFGQGQTWTLLGGPHDWNGTADPSPSSEWNSLDLTCNTINSSCDGVVRAARAGVVHFDGCAGNYVRVDHLDGWSTSFYHLLNIQVGEGQSVARGQALGSIGQGVGCGGSAPSPHTHFSVWYAGNFALTSDAAEDTEAHAVDGVDIGGWTVHAGGQQYDGCLVRDSDGNSQCASSGQIRNDGAIGSAGTGALAGVVGTDGSLFSKLDAQDFQRLDGSLLAAPAIVSVPGTGQPLYIGVGGDHQLYVRSNYSPWQGLVDGPNGCWDNPAAAVTPDGAGGFTLTVACQGGDTGLYYWQTGVATSGYPRVTSGYVALMGQLGAGPALAAINGTLTFFAVAASNHFVYSRTASTPYVQISAACNGHPAVASRGTVTYLACQGTDNALYYARYSGSGWGPFQNAGGRLIDGPGIALTSTATVYVEGSDAGLYHTVINPANDQASSFVADGGRLQFGAGGVGLR